MRPAEHFTPFLLKMLVSPATVEGCDSYRLSILARHPPGERANALAGRCPNGGHHRSAESRGRKVNATNDRRRRSRFPLALAVRYTGAGGRLAGVEPDAEHKQLRHVPGLRPPDPARLKAEDHDPVADQLNGTTPLQLIAVGTVVRSTESNT